MKCHEITRQLLNVYFGFLLVCRKTVVSELDVSDMCRSVYFCGIIYELYGTYRYAILNNGKIFFLNPQLLSEPWPFFKL